jgi:hypothetical protein
MHGAYNVKAIIKVVTIRI